MSAFPITATDSATPAIIAALIAGAVPEGWESTELVVNLADANDAQQAVIQQGAQKALNARAAGTTTKAESPEAYVFEMESKFPLSKSLKEAGWQQWHCSVQTVSRDECARMQVKYKKYRYPVHLWISPEGEIALAKIKMQGKMPLN